VCVRVGLVVLGGLLLAGCVAPSEPRDSVGFNATVDDSTRRDPPPYQSPDPAALEAYVSAYRSHVSGMEVKVGNETRVVDSNLTVHADLVNETLAILFDDVNVHREYRTPESNWYAMESNDWVRARFVGDDGVPINYPHDGFRFAVFVLNSTTIFLMNDDYQSGRFGSERPHAGLERLARAAWNETSAE